ncbi:hypothetical protein DXG03_007028 [Asterophora parasitica]|uniref:Co-chaperone HscB C-terminal oligomerisation domain-containing protein n=1 Tax=Asterophora parasitica TaxID=117018 RepID=A0A9P7GCH9_9AGAR|nr:hypothetical protein DXG03_007028 [Asterophora parasitica]
MARRKSLTSVRKNKQDIAQALSARINEAYQGLLNPLSRAEYILQRHHVPISETEQVDDIEFMSEIMESREIIDEAEDRSEVESLVDQNNSLFIPTTCRVSLLIGVWAAEIQNTVKELEDTVGKARWEDVKSAAVRLRYLQGIERAAKKWLDNN